MTLAAVRKGFGRYPFSYLEIDLERCANTYGTAPCTAALAAGSECLNCLASCQDLPNYDGSATLTIRLLPRSAVGLAVGFEGYPCLGKVTIKPTENANGDGLSSRERLDADLYDFTQHDRDMDPYWSTRASAAAGTWLGRLRARFPYFVGSAVRYYQGYLVDGAIDAANFEVRSYIIDQLDPPSQGMSKLVARDTLRLADQKSAKAPLLSAGALTADITASALSLDVTSGNGIDYRLSENLFAASGDFTDPAWTNSGLAITANAGNDIHGNAVADQLADDSAAAAESISQAASDYTVSEPFLVAADIEKDAVGRATRFVVLRLRHAGSTTEDSDIALDTSTGETDITTSTGATGGAIDYGTHWRLWIVATSNDASNTSATGFLLPAAGASATWVQGVAATGSILASRPQIERNSSIGWFIDTTTAAVKNGLYVLVGDEIILVDDRAGDTLSWASTANRGKWNTTADAHSADDAVQAGLDLNGLNMARAAELLLLHYTDLPPARIPFTDWEAQRTSKLAPYTIDTGLIMRPEGVLNLLADLAACCLTNIWDDVLGAGSINLAAMAPQAVDTELNENDHFLKRTLKLREQPEKRVNSVWVRYGLADVLNPTKKAGYRKTEVKLGNQNYKVAAIKEIYCRWFSTASPAIVLAYRTAIMLGDTPIEAEFALDGKDGALKTGNAIDVVSDALPDLFGNAQLFEMLITSTQPVDMPDGTRRINYRAGRNPFTGNYGLIAPNTTPSYLSASDAERAAYMFIGENGGANFSDGTPPKQIT